MTTQMDWMHYATFSKCAALTTRPSFPNRGSLTPACLAPRRYHPDNTARMPDLSLPEPVKGPEPLCKTTDHDVLKGMWGHAQQSELQYGPVDSSHKVRTPPARGANPPCPSSRPAPSLSRGPGEDQLGDSQDRPAVEHAV